MYYPKCTCQYLPILANTCEYLPILASTCQYLPKVSKVYLPTCYLLFSFAKTNLAFVPSLEALTDLLEVRKINKNKQKRALL